MCTCTELVRGLAVTWLALGIWKPRLCFVPLISLACPTGQASMQCSRISSRLELHKRTSAEHADQELGMRM